MRLSSAKINHLANIIMEYLRNEGEVEFYEDDSEIRLEVARVIQEELREDELIDQAVRYKIESQAREIPEGSEEWDILYRRYYDDEVSRRQKIIPTSFAPAPEHPH
ncbi:MAG TPA: DUF507 family protein [Vicinamibacteria bacterium]|nr:DUF507 family protein [Vicinamibacteria bacterium]